MGDFPKIDSPCPLRMAALPRAGADFCGQCSRRVHDLSAMDAGQRRAFMASCGDASVCVAYTVAVRRPRAALSLGVGLAAAIAVAPALAADPLAASLQSKGEAVLKMDLAAPAEYCPDDDDATEIIDIEVLGGTVTRGGTAEWIDGDSALAELPRAGADAFLDAEEVSFGPAPDDAPR